MQAQVTETVLNLPPSKFLADDNTRYSLRPARVESLMANIIAVGGVIVPIQAEPLEHPIGDAEYRILAGHYRHAAVEKANREKGAGLTLPAIVVNTDDAVDRFKTQLSENLERENMTPMDTATAIKKLLDMDVSKVEVRTIFSRPGGKKGGKVQPASNSFINMMLSFLEFPKAVQKKIHDGEIGVSGAYQLSKIQKAKPEKFQEVLAELESARLKAIEDEEKDEEKLLTQQKKEEEAVAKQQALAKEVEEAASVKVKALNDYGELAKAEVTAHTAAKVAATLTKEEKEAAEAAFKAAQEASKNALQAAEAAKKAEEKLAAKLAKAQEKAAENRKALEAARGKSAKKTAGDKEVGKAAKRVGAEVNYVPLKLADVREFIHEGALPATQPKVQAIFKAIEDVILGVTTPKDCFRIVSKITGETKSK